MHVRFHNHCEFFGAGFTGNREQLIHRFGARHRDAFLLFFTAILGYFARLFFVLDNRELIEGDIDLKERPRRRSVLASITLDRSKAVELVRDVPRFGG